MRARQAERSDRAAETPIVGGLPDHPGIVATLMISPALGQPLRALADALLVHEFPGASLRRAERELIATCVSAANDCFFCMDSHGAFAEALLQEEGTDAARCEELVDAIKTGSTVALPPRMQELLRIALIVRESGRRLESDDVRLALEAGASDGDVQLAVLIASAFCMYNRMVDGMRARTPADPSAHFERAGQIVQDGYSGPGSAPASMEAAFRAG